MITVEKLKTVLGWSAVINMGLLLLMSIIILGAKEFIYAIWNYFFALTTNEFDMLMISMIAFWKILVFVFFIIPYLALRIVSKEK